jgi:hypothetical protein
MQSVFLEARSNLVAGSCKCKRSSRPLRPAPVKVLQSLSHLPPCPSVPSWRPTEWPRRLASSWFPGKFRVGLTASIVVVISLLSALLISFLSALLIVLASLLQPLLTFVLAFLLALLSALLLPPLPTRRFSILPPALIFSPLAVPTTFTLAVLASSLAISLWTVAFLVPLFGLVPVICFGEGGIQSAKGPNHLTSSLAFALLPAARRRGSMQLGWINGNANLQSFSPSCVARAPKTAPPIAVMAVVPTPEC